MADLTTYANVKSFLDLADDAHQTLLTSLVTRASDFVIAHTGRAIIDPGSGNEITEIHDGIGKSLITLRDYPVATITGMTLHSSADQTFDATTLIAAADYYVDLPMGQILRKSGVGFGFGRKSVQVVYRPGYGETVTDVPGHVEDAVIELIALKYRMREKLGITSDSLGDASRSFYSPADIAGHIALLLAPLMSGVRGG